MSKRVYNKRAERQRINYMSNKYLKPIYKKVYEEDFKNTLENRIKLQKLVYLFQEAGYHLDDNYYFSWYLYGPYSQALQQDIIAIKSRDNYTINYSEGAEKWLKNLQTIFKNNGSYTVRQWAECLASLQYIRTLVVPSYSSDETIIKELISRKPYLDQKKDNARALKVLKEYYD